MKKLMKQLDKIESLMPRATKRYKADVWLASPKECVKLHRQLDAIQNRLWKLYTPVETRALRGDLDI